MTREDERRQMAQVIHDSFYAMQAGEFPDPATRELPNSGDMQLASDLQEAGYGHIAPTGDRKTLAAQLAFDAAVNNRARDIAETRALFAALEATPTESTPETWSTT